MLDSANVGADAILPEALACDTGELGRVIAALWDTFLMRSRHKKIVIVVASIDEQDVCLDPPALLPIGEYHVNCGILSIFCVYSIRN